MKPIDWRLAQNLTLDEAARRAGVVGVNPGRTYQRYENGRRPAPASVVEGVHRASAGAVGPSDWHKVRLEFLGFPSEERAA